MTRLMAYILGLLRTSQDFSGLLRTSQDFSRLLRTSQDFSGLLRTSQDFSGLLRSLQEFAGVRRSSQKFTQVRIIDESEGKFDKTNRIDLIDSEVSRSSQDLTGRSLQGLIQIIVKHTVCV
jgi:hypothetical protein